MHPDTMQLIQILEKTISLGEFFFFKLIFFYKWLHYDFTVMMTDML